MLLNRKDFSENPLCRGFGLPVARMLEDTEVAYLKDLIEHEVDTLGRATGRGSRDSNLTVRVSSGGIVSFSFTPQDFCAVGMTYLNAPDVHSIFSDTLRFLLQNSLVVLPSYEQLAAVQPTQVEIDAHIKSQLTKMREAVRPLGSVITGAIQQRAAIFVEEERQKTALKSVDRLIVPMAALALDDTCEFHFNGLMVLLDLSWYAPRKQGPRLRVRLGDGYMLSVTFPEGCATHTLQHQLAGLMLMIEANRTYVIECANRLGLIEIVSSRYETLLALARAYQRPD